MSIDILSGPTPSVAELLAQQKHVSKELKKIISPDCDLCSSCKDHAEFEENEDGETLSNCCGAPAYNTDYETDMER